MSTEQEQVEQLADKIASMALEQCRVYASLIPASQVRGILAAEVTLDQKKRTLEYAVLKQIERRVNKFK